MHHQETQHEFKHVAVANHGFLAATERPRRHEGNKVPMLRNLIITSSPEGREEKMKHAWPVQLIQGFASSPTETERREREICPNEAQQGQHCRSRCTSCRAGRICGKSWHGRRELRRRCRRIAVSWAVAFIWYWFVGQCSDFARLSLETRMKRVFIS